ncbi:MAG: hypothetical protein ABW123_10195 [Cystobacter sp.]
MPRLVCVSREPEGLMGLVLPDEEDASRLSWVPLAQVSGPGAEERASLRASWEHLGHARGASVDTLTHVLRVLLFTVAGEPGPAPSLAHPWLEPPVPAHRRTAAHPRGYRGTLHQPPKRARPRVLDVRPYLLHRSMARALLDPLRPHLDEALQRLADEGLPRERLRLVHQALDSPSRADVGLAWRHGVLEERGAALPASLPRLGSLLTPGVSAEFGRLLALRGRLALDTHPEVMLLAARLLAEVGPDKGLGWLEVAASLVPDSQVVLLKALFDSKSCAAEASGYDLRFEDAFASHPPEWREYYVRGLSYRLPSDFLLTGLRLLDVFGVTDLYCVTVSHPARSGPVPEALFLELRGLLGPMRFEGYMMFRLWALCGEFEGFAALLSGTPWASLSVDAIEQLLEELSSLRDSEKVHLNGWAAVRELHPRLMRLLARIPASHQRRAIQMVFRVLGQRGVNWSGPDWLESTTFALVECLCRPPFAAEDRFAYYVLRPLLTHPSPDVRARLPRTSERSLLRFEANCSRGDLNGLVGYGMRLMAGRQGPLVVEALESCPETLVRTVQLLGSVHDAAAVAMLDAFALHPWVRENPLQWPPAVLVASLREHCVEGVESPLPRKARLAWEAGAELSPAQTERALRLAATQLPRLRLQVLARGVLAFLRGRLEADVSDTRVRHALQMARLVEGNRRGLRRLLNHYFAGERDFIVQHPASRAWFARHPRVKPELWLTGPVLHREVPGWGRVTLALERDVLEVLRMGTYVGSCFGLNGIRAESAAAVALDVNKRVLYARDSRGSVLARQLLAVSDDDMLVPFSIYPASTPPVLQSFFLDYDLAFAEALGLPLSEGKKEPDVQLVLSTSFWHDGTWELVAPQ